MKFQKIFLILFCILFFIFISFGNEYSEENDLENYIDEIFLNTVITKGCEIIFLQWEENIKNDILNQVLQYESNLEMAQYFFDSLSYTQKYEIIKDISYELMKDVFTQDHTSSQKEDFYNLVYSLSEEHIASCVIRNNQREIQNFLQKLSQIKQMVQHCWQEWNTLKLHFLHHYSIYR